MSTAIKTAAELVASAITQEQAKAADIPAALGVVMTLAKTGDSTHRHQYRGWSDRAGTVRVRAYLSGTIEDNAGEVFTINTQTGCVDGDLNTATNVAKLVYEQDGAKGANVFVVWQPADAKIKTITLQL